MKLRKQSYHSKYHIIGDYYKEILLFSIGKFGLYKAKFKSKYYTELNYSWYIIQY